MNDTTQNLEHKNICNKKSLDAEITYQVNGTSFVVQPIFKEILNRVSKVGNINSIRYHQAVEIIRS